MNHKRSLIKMAHREGGPFLCFEGVPQGKRQKWGSDGRFREPGEVEFLSFLLVFHCAAGKKTADQAEGRGEGGGETTKKTSNDKKVVAWNALKHTKTIHNPMHTCVITEL